MLGGRCFFPGAQRCLGVLLVLFGGGGGEEGTWFGLDGAWLLLGCGGVPFKAKIKLESRMCDTNSDSPPTDCTSKCPNQ